MGLHPGDKLEFVITEKGKARFRSVVKKVDEVFRRLYKAGNKPVSIEEMDTVVRQKMQASFK